MDSTIRTGLAPWLCEIIYRIFRMPLKLKFKTSLFLVGLLICNSGFTQVTHSIEVPELIEQEENSKGLKAGIFYFQHWLPLQNTVFQYSSDPKQYNILREIKFYSECWRFSVSHADVLEKMETMNLKDWLETLQVYGDDVVVKFNAMPYWLSSSNDLSPLPGDNSWYIFQTYPPEDYSKWDSIVIDVVTKISDWGIHPYYELWNEPDGQYWKGTNKELLKLYKHTALAIKQADPLAKVGGFGLHTWWRSADEADYQNQEPYKSLFYGFTPGYIAEEYSVLYMLLDSVINNWANDSVPLDFISWHYFRLHPEEIVYIAEMLNDKMFQLGYCDPDSTNCFNLREIPEHYISEWQSTFGAQEQDFQPSFFIRQISKMNQAGIKKHSIAAINDFAPSPDDEFTHGWGLMSQNALLKPVFKAIDLMHEVSSNGVLIKTRATDGLDVFASYAGDTLRILISNYTLPCIWYSPQYWKVGWNSFDQLLYDTSSLFTKPDYINAGLQSYYWGNNPPQQWGNLDLYFQGQSNQLPPINQQMEDQIISGRQQWVQDSLWNESIHNVSIKLADNHNTLNGNLIRIDTTHNNVIHLYDSLINIGYTHQRAIDSLQSCTFPGGCFGFYWQTENITITDSIYSLSIQPNSVCLLTLPGIDLEFLQTNISEENRIENNIKVYPNPASSYVSFNLDSDHNNFTVFIHDISGQTVYHHDMLKSSFKINIEEWNSGIYFYKIISDKVIYSGKIVIH